MRANNSESDNNLEMSDFAFMEEGDDDLEEGVEEELGKEMTEEDEESEESA